MSEYDESSDAVPDGHVQAGHTQMASDAWGAATTGVAAVDEVLVAVRALDSRPVGEHVAVFEQAHDRLRRALDPGHG